MYTWCARWMTPVDKLRMLRTHHQWQHHHHHHHHYHHHSHSLLRLLTLFSVFSCLFWFLLFLLFGCASLLGQRCRLLSYLSSRSYLVYVDIYTNICHLFYVSHQKQHNNLTNSPSSPHGKPPSHPPSSPPLPLPEHPPPLALPLSWLPPLKKEPQISQVTKAVFASLPIRF